MGQYSRNIFGSEEPDISRFAADGKRTADAGLAHRGASRNGSGQAPSCNRGSLAPPRWPSGDGRYGVVSTALSKKDSNAPFASSGAFGLVLHWPLCGPDVNLGTFPAP